MLTLSHPPKLIYDESGSLVEVILSADDYLTYIRSVARDSDWETLPEHIQDAVDRLLIDEVRSEKDAAVALETLLTRDEPSA